uniref:Uncharacterized protein n=1 Tax=Anguilla anguilla TaxID=7936 RepID=A0A0E9UH03_ANGAN
MACSAWIETEITSNNAFMLGLVVLLKVKI